MLTWIGSTAARRAALLAASLLVLGGGAASAGAAPTVTIVDLGTFGGTQSIATGINASGQVVGFASFAGDTVYHAFSWTGTSGLQDLGTLGGSTSSANAVNDAGQVVGSSDITGNAGSHAFSWTTAGGMVDLGTLGGSSSYATGVSDNGLVIGESTLAGDVVTEGFWWTKADGIHPLTLTDGAASQALAVNGTGLVAGWGTTGGGSTGLPSSSHAFVWSLGGGIVDIHDEVNTALVGVSDSLAVAVNDLGDVAGYGFGASHTNPGFVWSASDGATDLGQIGFRYTLPTALNDADQVVGTTGGPFGTAFIWQSGVLASIGNLGGPAQPRAINASGEVVGQSFPPGANTPHGFWWTSSTGMVNLGTLGGAYSSAGAIDDAGQVIGVAALTGDAARHAVMWTVSAAVDANGDGIVDSLQPSGTPAGSFVDASLSPATTGSIVDSGGLAVTITDAANATDGVEVDVGTGSGVATLSVCGGFTLQVNAGSSVVVTCGSVTLKVTAGAVSVVLGGGITVVSVPAGSTGKVTDLGGGSFGVQNLGTGGSVSVTTNGQTSTVAAGGSSTVPVVTLANLCTLTTQMVQGSAKYRALSAKQRQAADQLAKAACAFLQQITPKLSVKQKAALIAGYKAAVQALVSPGWLTQAQADTLKTLAGTV